jgi:hypothetical protein
MSSTNDLTFDFIADDEFRASLQSDYHEMARAFEAESWKAVHVLAGSVIEALLVEYLVVSGVRPKGKDPLTVTLGEAIEECQKAKVLTPKTASLCDVVKDYRNLIHPGRLIRLQEKYGQGSAQIALSLVGMITSEVAQKRKESYGLTAEQIVRKIAIDVTASSLIPNLLSETSEFEKKRLVERIIPEAYRSESSDVFPNEKTLSALVYCYRQSLSSLPQDDQARTAKRFARMVREESSEKIAAYADAFFSCEEIKHLNSIDRALVKKQIFARLEQVKLGGDFPSQIVETLKGIGPYLEDHDIIQFTNLCVRFVSSGVEASQVGFMNLLSAEYEALETAELRTKMESHIGAWIEHAKERKYPADRIERLERLSVLCSDIPF